MVNISKSEYNKSNPWRGEDCARLGCLHCLTKLKTGKYSTQCCKKRSLIYETWCKNCEEQGIKEIKDSNDDDKMIKEKIEKMTLYKYLGESSRSTFERGLNDKKQLNVKSHMLKHCIETHPEERAEEVEFGMRVVAYCRTSFERQMMEILEIQKAKTQHHILNSKSEYNRCDLPRLTTKIGENDFKKWEDNHKEEKDKEKRTEEVVGWLVY